MIKKRARRLKISKNIEIMNTENFAGTANNLLTELQEELAQWSAAGQRRVLQAVDSACSRTLRVNGEVLLNFASNDYLGLASHPQVVAALQEGAGLWGAGSGASHLLGGHLRAHQDLADALAAFTGFDRVLTFSTGYLANLAVTPSLAGRGAAIFADRLNHASLIDAMQLTKAGGAEIHRYPHNDTGALAGLLANSRAKRKIIVTDAVFSMDGDLAPLSALLALAQRHAAWLVVDDAHGFGVLGEGGRGSLSHCNLPAHPQLILMATLGKAAGVGGAFVAANATVGEYLLQKARTYIFTTAAPPALSMALQTSLRLLQEPQRQATLRRHINRLRAACAELPWHLLPSDTAIQALVVGDNQAALTLSQRLRAAACWVPAIRPPTVPAGSARLRISLSAAHRDEDIDQLITALQCAAKTLV